MLSSVAAEHIAVLTGTPVIEETTASVEMIKEQPYKNQVIIEEGDVKI